MDIDNHTEFNAGTNLLFEDEIRSNSDSDLESRVEFFHLEELGDSQNGGVGDAEDEDEDEDEEENVCESVIY